MSSSPVRWWGRWRRRRLWLGTGLVSAGALAMGGMGAMGGVGASADANRDPEAPVDERAALEPLPPPTPIAPASMPVEPSTPAPDPVAAPPEPVPAPGHDAWAGDPRWIRHRVVPRESLSQIALRYGVSVAQLRSWNDLAPDAIVQARDRLKVWARRFPPPRERREHAVVLGDTWGSVARAYGVSSADLRSTNVSKTGRRLDEGEVLQLWIDPAIYEHIQQHVAEQGPLADVYPGGHSVGTPNDGRLVNGARIPEDQGYELRFPNSSWGTSHAVEHVVRAMAEFRRRSAYTGRIALGTMSRERGGDVGGHASHQSGRDLDVRLPLREALAPGTRVRARTIDWEATWHLVKAFVDTGEVAVVFLDYGRQRHLHGAAQAMGIDAAELDRVLQYPIGRASSRGLVRHSSGHEAHLHVRFVCGDFETECAD